MSPSYTLSLSPLYTRTHLNCLSHCLTHANTLSFLRYLSLSLTHTHKRTLLYYLSLSLTHEYFRTLSLFHTQTLSHSLSLTHTQKRTLSCYEDTSYFMPVNIGGTRTLVTNGKIKSEQNISQSGGATLFSFIFS